ncbi:hypothetical protein MAPG_11326 [Magnaporthiopsis poae ATCC 64411]|uniref:Uncharacterized protein n=1 Tax=Magnaporthiopsis poae (strain ATCC 64411 / 73-15) TaxID=644358 RepID=A0A0C4EEZ4_MAGP6|nr:hypothetical protein MAPG_11326 [Magnaporthiopsis poae ATCC 64411]
MQAPPFANRRASFGHNRIECQRGCCETCRRLVTEAAERPPDPTAMPHAAGSGLKLGRDCKVFWQGGRPMRPPKRRSGVAAFAPATARQIGPEGELVGGNDEILPCHRWYRGGGDACGRT